MDRCTSSQKKRSATNNNSSRIDNDDHCSVLSSTSSSSSSSSTTTSYDKLSEGSMHMSTCTTKTKLTSTKPTLSSSTRNKIFIVRFLEIFVVLSIVLYQSISFIDYICNEYIKQYIIIQQWDDTKRSKYSMYYGRTCRSIDTTTTVRDDLYLQASTPQPHIDSSNNNTSTTSDNDNNNNFINHMNIHGAMIIPNLLSETTASALRNYILKENNNSGKSILLKKMNHRWSFSLKLHNDISIQIAIQELLSNKQLLNGIEQLIGHVDPSMIELSAITAEYGAQTQSIHSDSSSMASGTLFSRNFIPSYSIFIPLQNTTTTMGATIIAPGTHMCVGTSHATIRTFPLSESSYTTNTTTIDTTTNTTTNSSLSPSIWQVGTGVIMNSQLLHYGPAYTDPDGIKRVIIIPTFTNRPLISKSRSNQLSRNNNNNNNNNNKLVVESRTISHGTVYGIHWSYLGHTVSDWLSECYYYLNNTNTNAANGNTFLLQYVRTILRSLRSFGIINYNHPTYTSWTFWQQTFNRLAIHDISISPYDIVNEYIPNNTLLHYFLFGSNKINKNDDNNDNDNNNENDTDSNNYTITTTTNIIQQTKLTTTITTTTSSRRTVVTIPNLDDYDITVHGSIVSQFLFDLVQQIRTIVSIIVSCTITLYLLYLVRIRRSYTISTTNRNTSTINTIQKQSKSSLLRIIYFYLLIEIGIYTYRIYYIDQSVWGKNIKSGRAVNIPDHVAQSSSTFTTTSQRRLSTIPTSNDILLTYHVQSHYLGAYRTLIDMKHPGNIYWYNTIVPYYANMYKTVSDSSLSSLQHTICTFIIQQDLYMNDDNDNDQRRILTKNYNGQWTVTAYDEAIQFCHISLLNARTTIVQKEIIQEINYLWTETQYGYFRNTALHRIHIPQYISLLKNKLTKYIPYEEYQLLQMQKRIRHTQYAVPIRLSPTPLLSYQSSIEHIKQSRNAVSCQFVVPKSMTSSSIPNLAGNMLVRSPSTISSIVQQLLDSTSVSDDGTSDNNKVLVQSHYSNEPFPGAWIAENDIVEVLYTDDDNEKFWYIGRIESLNTYKNTVNIIFPDGEQYLNVKRGLIRRPIVYGNDEEIQISLNNSYQYTDGRILRIVNDDINNEEEEEVYQYSIYDNKLIRLVEVAIYKTRTILIVSSTRIRRYPIIIEEDIE